MIPALIVISVGGCTPSGGGKARSDGGTDHTGTVPTTSTTSATDPVPVPVIPGPDEDGHDPDLARLVEDHGRVFSAVLSGPHGLALSASLTEPGLVEDWVTGGSGWTAADLEAHTGAAVVDLVIDWNDLDEVGLYGGVGALGEIWRYAALRDDPGADPAEVDAARTALQRVMETLHIQHVITGRSGTIARGLGTTDLAGLEDVEPVDLFDADGDPLPRDKEPTWRADQSGMYPGLMWIDDAGKDQLAGYVLALGAAWQVASDDPAIDPDLVADLASDARDIGLALMEPSPHTGVDLTLLDADGRHVSEQDLSATEADGIDLGRVGNPYNAVLSMSLVRTLGTVSGDPAVGAFFGELADERGYLDQVPTLGSSVYYGYATDYREVLVMYAALLSWLLHEDDPARLDAATVALQRMWPRERATEHHLDPLATIVTAAWVGVEDGELEVALDHLRGFPEAPHLDLAVENCDPDELATASCVAVDGITPVDVYGFWNGDTFEPEPAFGGVLVATEALPHALRPPEPFSWAADPYRINGGGSDRLLSAADLRAAYWLGRCLDRAR